MTDKKEKRKANKSKTWREMKNEYLVRGSWENNTPSWAKQHEADVIKLIREE